MLRLYDTRTQQVEPIGPARRGSLRMYACGPDTGRPAHLGDLRCYLLADLIRRAAEHSQLQVSSCLSIIDVGQRDLDTMRHHETGFHADCAALNIRPADSTPRASESAELIIELISKLLETGHAYQTDAGSVYFGASSFPGYGELSGHKPDADWALWQAAPAAPGGQERAWPAPWGSGFPGWSTACAAMSLHCLGEHIDVQTGGIGLLFPHHEEERAESDSVAGHEVVRHWVHGEHLLFEGREMASSAGNVVLLGELTGRGLDPLALRLVCLEHRYRQPLNLSWDTLAAADATVRRWRQWVAEWANSPSRAMCAQYVADFLGAFDDDLDTPAALGVLRGLEQDGEIPPGAKFETFAYADRLLGLDLARDIGRAPAPPAR